MQMQGICDIALIDFLQCQRYEEIKLEGATRHSQKQKKQQAKLANGIASIQSRAGRAC
jgi:hypothetical protein